MRFDGEQIMTWLKEWHRLGVVGVFTATEKVAYIFDKKNGATLQIVSPKGMQN